MREIANTRVRFGFWRIYVVLRREGWKINQKRMYRLYNAEELGFGTKPPRRRKTAANRMDRIVRSGPNQSWIKDFVSGVLFDGRKFRMLADLDNHIQKYLAIGVAKSLTCDNVDRALANIGKERHQYPLRIEADDRPEFVSSAHDKWAHENWVAPHFSRPGKLTENPLVECFNGSLADEYLCINCFMSLEDANEKIETRK